VVNGTLYATAGSRRASLHWTRYRELLWIHGGHEGKPEAAAPRQLRRGWVLVRR